jgi:hypothetical protein
MFSKLGSKTRKHMGCVAASRKQHEVTARTAPIEHLKCYARLDGNELCFGTWIRIGCVGINMAYGKKQRDAKDKEPLKREHVDSSFLPRRFGAISATQIPALLPLSE